MSWIWGLKNTKANTRLSRLLSVEDTKEKITDLLGCSARFNQVFQEVLSVNPWIVSLDLQ